MKLSELGEFPLIARLARLVTDAPLQAHAPGARLRISIGDDAAVWSPSPGTFQTITTDALVEGVHFDLRTTSWRELGWKALAVNVSDIAAMATLPRYALVTLCLQPEQRVENVEELYLGMKEAAQAYGVVIVGGDTTSAPIVVINITMVGEGAPGQRDLLLRSAGQPGFRLAVTGWLGSSTGGLRLLQSGVSQPEDPDHRLLIDAHRRPQARVEAARLLLDVGLRCGMDISDGLLGDTTRICEASGTGAVLWVDRVPVHPSLRRVFPGEATDMALAGGEDYEILVAGPARLLDQAAEVLYRQIGLPLTQVGELTEAPPEGPRVRVLDATGREYRPTGWSWQHFTEG